MKRRIIALLCAGCLFSLTACQEDIEITEVPMPPVEEEPEPTPDDTDKIYECEHPLLLTEQAQGRILIVDADTRETLWEWRAASAADMPDATSLMRLPSEVKAIYNRRYILATASGGGVAIIRIADKKVMFYASAGNNPHSAEVFPDGNLVVASTDNDGFLSTFRVDTVARTGQVVQKLPLTFCHSAVWDRSRGRLLSTSDNKLCVFTYNGDGNDPRITKESETSIPEGNWAHDLFPVYGENALWLTNNDYAMKVSGSDLSMETVGFSQSDIKSVSSGPEGFPTVLLIPKADEWWNTKVIDTEGRTVFEQNGMQIYKARWFLDNPYSYPAKHDFVQPAK